jgi:hypothetical protein
VERRVRARDGRTDEEHAKISRYASRTIVVARSGMGDDDASVFVVDV